MGGDGGWDHTFHFSEGTSYIVEGVQPESSPRINIAENMCFMACNFSKVTLYKDQFVDHNRNPQLCLEYQVQTLLRHRLVRGVGNYPHC